MAKAKPCIVLCNNKWGYIMAPHEAKSVAEGKKWAKDLDLAYRIYDLKGKLICRGW